MDLDRWVNDNNPDEQLQYSKGWLPWMPVACAHTFKQAGDSPVAPPLFLRR